MNLERCQRLVKEFLTRFDIPTEQLEVQCVQWDGTKLTRTARAYFTAECLSEQPSDASQIRGKVFILPDRVHGGDAEVLELLKHEMIHAYDHCVLKRDLSQCEQLACSEVRAAREAECSRTSDAFCDFQPLGAAATKRAFCDRRIKNCVVETATRSTKSVFPETGARCVEKVVAECMLDTRKYGTSYA